MECVVFIPGIMGSRLRIPGGDEVWPPTVAETQFGYDRRDELSRPDLQVTDIIRKVWCVDIYQPLLDQFAQMGFTEAAGAKRLVPFAYDWRQDLEKTADKLAARLAALAQEGATKFTVVAHSMGGLVARLMLEGGRHDAAPWFKRVTGFLALATPHLGAPLALARVLGLDSALGISKADIKIFANDERYPSAYQLLPAPGEASCWNVRERTLPAVDIYDPQVAAQLGLKPALLARAKFVHDTLAKGKPPAHVRYFYFAATGHATVTRINLMTSGAQVTSAEDAGDGTVPMWSALPRSLQKQLVPGEHSGFFKASGFKAVFFRLLGADFPTPPLALAATEVDLSVGRLVYPDDAPIDVLLALPVPTGFIDGRLRLSRTDDPDAPFAEVGQPMPVTYNGPNVDTVRLVLPPVRQRGQYRLTFRGLPGNARPAFFAVHE